ncbi:AAA family ATPase [bacterium]|nr:AAA family ATPase [bacterium]
MKNNQEHRILNDLDTPVMSIDTLEITNRPIRRKKVSKIQTYSDQVSQYQFNPVEDVDFREFLERDTGVEFNSENKMNPCPICGHNDSLSTVPDNPQIMNCFSDQHNKAFNIWAYMDRVHALKGYRAVKYIAQVMSIRLSESTVSPQMRKPKLKLLSAEQIINDPRPKPEDLIGGGLLPSAGLLVITGSEKVFKSFISLEMAIHLVSGGDWQGHSITKPYKCIVLNAEGGYYSLRDRLKSMIEGHKKSFNHENLYLSEVVSLNLLEAADYSLLSQELAKHKADVLVIDPLVRFHDGDENASNDMAGVMSVLRELIQQFKISIILIHHGTKGGIPMRGSSVMLGEYDSMMHLTTTQKDASLNIGITLRHAPKPPDMKLIFHPDTFSFGQVRKLHTTAKEAIKEQLITGGMERKRLKKVVLKKSVIAERTFDNNLRQMIKNNEIVEKNNFLELSHH